LWRRIRGRVSTKCWGVLRSASGGLRFHFESRSEKAAGMTAELSLSIPTSIFGGGSVHTARVARNILLPHPASAVSHFRAQLHINLERTSLSLEALENYSALKLLPNIIPSS
jgi:hypothetical protein